jgi:signal peptidase I
MGQETEERTAEEQTTQVTEVQSTDQPATEERKTRQQRETVLRFIIKLCAVLLALWAIFTFVFGIRQVDGESMYPRLRDGDLILYYRLEQDYQVGDVVAFSVCGEPQEARIVAQGGDVVELSSDGQLLVNGAVQQEDIFYLTEPQGEDITYPYTVEEDSYFVLSDSRTSGIDSRSFGSISQKEIRGKVITVLRRRGI